MLNDSASFKERGKQVPNILVLKEFARGVELYLPRDRHGTPQLAEQKQAIEVSNH